MLCLTINNITDILKVIRTMLIICMLKYDYDVLSHCSLVPISCSYYCVLVCTGRVIIAFDVYSLFVVFTNYFMDILL